MGESTMSASGSSGLASARGIAAIGESNWGIGKKHIIERWELIWEILVQQLDGSTAAGGKDGQLGLPVAD